MRTSLASNVESKAKAKPEPEQKPPEIEIELDQPADPQGTTAEIEESIVDPDDSASGIAGSPTGPDATGSGIPTYLPDAQQLRDMLFHEPELLEAGLQVYTDKKGQSVGGGYETPVGDIDLLARDVDGALVVVLVAEPDSESELVSQVLQRIGWVQKHLEKRKQAVRGIVLVETPTSALCYAASALGDNVRIVTYRLALAFEPLEL